jgi:hypothetical protein
MRLIATLDDPGLIRRTLAHIFAHICPNTSGQSPSRAAPGAIATLSAHSSGRSALFASQVRDGRRYVPSGAGTRAACR